MTETQLLIGSLSNDLLRTANLIYRGSEKGATRFLAEAKCWSGQLKDKKLKPYIKQIIQDIDTCIEPLTLARAEKLLMYSILLQNYCLHNINQ